MDNEAEKVKQLAKSNYRNFRDQASFMIRSELIRTGLLAQKELGLDDKDHLEGSRYGETSE